LGGEESEAGEGLDVGVPLGAHAEGAGDADAVAEALEAALPDGLVVRGLEADGKGGQARGPDQLES